MCGHPSCWAGTEGVQRVIHKEPGMEEALRNDKKLAQQGRKLMAVCFHLSYLNQLPCCRSPSWLLSCISMVLNLRPRAATPYLGKGAGFMLCLCQSQMMQCGPQLVALEVDTASAVFLGLVRRGFTRHRGWNGGARNGPSRALWPTSFMM